MRGARGEDVHSSAGGDGRAATGRDDLERHGASAAGNLALTQLVGQREERCLSLAKGDLGALAVDVAVQPPADGDQDDGGGRGDGQGGSGPHGPWPPAAPWLSRVHGRPPSGSRYLARSVGTAG